MKMSEFFELRGELPERTKLMLGVAGGILLLICWQLVSQYQLVRTSILPSPLKIGAAFPDLWAKHHLLQAATYSTTINVMGYLEATLIGVPIGFAIGLIPVFRAMF